MKKWACSRGFPTKAVRAASYTPANWYFRVFRFWPSTASAGMSLKSSAQGGVEPPQSKGAFLCVSVGDANDLENRSAQRLASRNVSTLYDLSGFITIR
jgi:hypothetical protein